MSSLGKCLKRNTLKAKIAKAITILMFFSINLVHILSCERNNYFIFLLLSQLVTDNLELSHYLKGKSFILFSGNFLDFKPRRQCLK